MDTITGDKKNIMYIFNDAIFGGAGQSLLDSLKELKKEVNPIVIIRQGIKIKDSFKALGLHCYEIRFSTDYVEIGSITEEKKASDFKQSYEAACQLVSIIKKEKIQVIHINSSSTYFAAIAALMTNVPFVCHIRELMEEQFGCEFLNAELRMSLYIRADKLISISDYVRQTYYEKYNLDTQRIYNGLDVGKFKLDIKENKGYNNVFLAAAMIMPEKGQWDAICAVEKLVKQGYSDVKLIIAGTGADEYIWILKKYVIKKKLDKNIAILPFQKDLSELRRKADYAITCSQNEALGRVTIESMFAGNVLIGAKSGGTIEIIGENEERGFLYELHNSDDLASTMLRAMQCPSEAKDRLLKEAQKYVESTFDPKKYCRKILDVYDEVIASHESKNHDKFLSELEQKYELMKNTEICESHSINNRQIKAETALWLAIKWLELKQEGKNLAEYFIRNHMQSVAIYGMAALGRRLYDELENSGVEIKYLLDRNPNGMEKILQFTSLDKERLEVDVIVVTVAAAEREIVKEIQDMGYEKVIGLSDILDDYI
ncbi:MAG: glycosyltransferase family 4 protein [Butyrivibrio sp.]|nr:glycosyltransferase family 4 protein [Butyrivibrio sp.]